jgi:hypothetical protein
MVFVRRTFLTFCLHAFFVLLLLCAMRAMAATPGDLAAAATAPTLRINEVLATNTKIANGGTFPDLIELYNGGSTAIDLSGKSLNDATSKPGQFVFPNGTTIAAGGYLMVYADSETTAPGLHAGFALDAEGDSVELHDTTAAGGGVIDSIVFGFQVPDYSLARTGTDGSTWTLTAPTPAAANASPAVLGALSGVKINEWAGKITFRVDHNFIELYNTGTQPVALGGTRLVNAADNHPKPFTFPAYSYIAGNGFMPLYGADLPFGLSGDFDGLRLLDAGGALIDRIDFATQTADHSTARTPDGGATLVDLTVPTPGISNTTVLPAAYSALLATLRITELMFEPAASSNAGDYEYIEMQNTGTAPLDLGGVRFDNGLDYTFPAGTTLAAGAYTVVCKNRTAFSSRYPGAVASLAPGQFTGSLDNSGETIALTLPAPWDVHILNFRYESDWYATTAGSGYSLVVPAPITTPAKDWEKKSTWRASVAAQGNPGAADAGGIAVVLGQAAAVTVAAGGPTALSVRVTSDSPATYQWQTQVNGLWINVAGATAATYTLPAAQVYQAGNYRVVVTVAGATLTSEVMTLTVTAPTASGARLANLATRATSLSGNNALLPGFVISGSGTKRILLRNVGPTLGSFGVAGTLGDPLLGLKRYNPTTGAYVDLAANDNWGTTTPLQTLIDTSTSVGAFALTAGSSDSALLVDLPPGQYSASAGGANDGAGIALLEIYDADTAASPTAKLNNISTRGFVGTGSNIIIAGFVISGAGSKTILVRAIGPTLGDFGLSGVLADPQLAIYKGNNAILSNDDWGAGSSSPTTASTATQVGAFALPATSKDAAFVITLPAGAYTAQVVGANGTTGLALVEIYEVL